MGRPQAASALMFSATLLTASAAAGDEAQPATTTVVLRVHDYARLPSDTLAEAHQRASRILASAGVRLEWVGRRDAAGAAPGTRQLTLLLLSERMADKKITSEGLGPNVLARAEKSTGRAHIMSHRIRRVATNYGRPLGYVLGTVVAHEIGHLLLPGTGHGRTGIMVGSLDPHLRSDTEARFTHEEATVIRAALASTQRHAYLGAEEHRPVAVQIEPLH